MGLTQAQVDKITSEWQQTVDAVHASLVKAGKFNWQLLQSSGSGFGRNFSGGLPGAKASCATFLRSACGEKASAIQSSPLIYEFTGTDHVYDQHRPFFVSRFSHFFCVCPVAGGSDLG